MGQTKSKPSNVELPGVEVFRIKEKELYVEWARYTLKMVALTLTRLNRVPVVQYEGDELVLYGVALRSLTIAGQELEVPHVD